MTTLHLTVVPGVYAVCRLAPSEAIPVWAMAESILNARGDQLLSVTRTEEELSIVCKQDRVPTRIKAERGWCCLKVEGPLYFTQTGILAELSTSLSAADISLFAISTFDTDYLLVKHANLNAAIAALTSAGHQIQECLST